MQEAIAKATALALEFDLESEQYLESEDERSKLKGFLLLEIAEKMQNWTRMIKMQGMDR